jgi:hypothetical protein
MDDVEVYFYLLTTLTYIIMIFSIVGIIWGCLLTIGRTRATITQTMKSKSKILFWFLNFTFWTVPFSLVAGFYFFSVWYVMNPQAKIYWFPHP